MDGRVVAYFALMRLFFRVGQLMPRFVELCFEGFSADFAGELILGGFFEGLCGFLRYLSCDSKVCFWVAEHGSRKILVHVPLKLVVHVVFRVI